MVGQADISSPPDWLSCKVWEIFVNSGLYMLFQFTNMHFEDSSPTELKTVHRQVLYCIIWNFPILTIN